MIIDVLKNECEVYDFEALEGKLLQKVKIDLDCGLSIDDIYDKLINGEYEKSHKL